MAALLPQAPTGPITAHFTWEEARCHHCGWIPGRAVVIATAEWAEGVREILGGHPMRVHSWCRCPVHNRAVGGVPNSQHLKGTAIDFAVAELSPGRVQAILRQHWPALVKGLGSYPGFTHIDRRPARPAKWTLATRARRA